MGNLVRLSKWDNPLFAKTTLYKWKCLGKFPHLFLKVSGSVFVDLDVLNEIIEAGRGKPVRLRKA